MAKMHTAFNAGSFDPTQAEFMLVPAGDYKVIVYDSEVKPTKNNSGGYLSLKIRVIEGDHAGSAIRPEMLNLWNANQQAVDIANRRLTAICYAMGMPNSIIEDSSQLHNKPFMVRVVVEDNEYLDRDSGQTKKNQQNKIVLIMGLDGKPPVKGGAAQPQQQGGPPPAMAQAQAQPQQPAQQQAPAAGWAPQGQPAPQQQPQQPPQGAAPAWGGPPPTQQPPTNGATPPPNNWGGPPAGAPAWGTPQ